MKPVSPYMRWLGAVFLVMFFALVTVKARAEVNVTCVTSLAPDVERIKDMHRRGTEYVLIRHLILTDSTNRGEARWALMQVLDRLDSGQLAADRAITFLWGLCSLTTQGSLDEKDEYERKEGPLFWPIQEAGKDI